MANAAEQYVRSLLGHLESIKKKEYELGMEISNR